MDIARFTSFRNKVVANVSQVIIGKDGELELILTALLSGGHVLLEDIPGMGKTMLVKALAKTLALDFKRIQFTPDLLPSDITGINYYNQKKEDFQFREGPLFGNIILADEINRATPRTQSALLEAMEERQVTADGETRQLARPFMVLATKNPVESFGTFPLPEAQLDRFFIRISLGYPRRDEEKLIIHKNIGNPLEGIAPVVTAAELDYCLAHVHEVTIQEDVMDYLLNIVDITRNEEGIELGVSPRGSIALFKATQAFAAINGRDYILPEDVRLLAPHVFNHRIIAKGGRRMQRAVSIIEEIAANAPVPLENR